jgi:hypothetical protein
MKTSANNIATMAGGHRGHLTSGLEAWPELIPTLIQALHANNLHLIFGAFETLELLCDDLHIVSVCFIYTCIYIYVCIVCSHFAELFVLYRTWIKISVATVQPIC